MKKLIVSYVLYGEEFPIMGVTGNDYTIVSAMGKRITKLIIKDFKLIHSDNTCMVYAHDIVDTQYKFTVIQ